MTPENEIRKKEVAYDEMLKSAGLTPLGAQLAAPALPKLEVPSLLDDLDHTLAILNDSLFELADRLEPVVRQEPNGNTTADEASRATGTLFGSRLNDYTIRANMMNVRVRQLINKLEV